MKRADLTVGTEYLASRSNDWQSDQWGHDKVTVESLDKVGTVTGWSRGSEIKFTDSKGVVRTVTGSRGGTNAVIVSYMERGYGSDRTPTRRYKIVPTTQIRGPWAEAKAVVDANTKAQAEQRAAKANRAADYRFRMETVNNRLVDLEVGGYGPDRKPYLYTSDQGEVRVPISLLEALLNEIEKD